MHLVQFALLVQLVQVAPDGGFACVQRLAQLLHGGGALPRQQIQNQAESLTASVWLCQRLAELS